MTHLRRARVAALVIVAVLAVAGGFAARSFNEGGSAHSTAALRNALATPGGGEPGEASLTKVEQYWQTRLTYPTGRFDQRWALKAAKQAKRIKSGIPKGHYKAWRGSGARQVSGSHGAQSVKALAAARPLGPQPQVSTGCQAPCFTFGLVSGRVSAIAFDPSNASVAYLAQDGGGIWKTTNCCTPFTTWAVTTDGASVGTTTTDDVTVDPNNSNVVYAATGDISFGSFAFGSAGILKSTNAGASWQTLGADVFTPVYPAASGGTYPQYQAISKVRVDPNNSKKVVVGTKTGLYFSYDAGVKLDRPLSDQPLPPPAPGRHRPDPPRRRIDDVGLRGDRRARLRDVRPAEPGQERSERRLQARFDPRERLSRSDLVGRADERLAGRHRGRRRLRAADRAEPHATLRPEREQARADRDGDRAERPAGHLRRGAGRRSAGELRRPPGTRLGRRAEAASSGCGAPRTAERAGRRSRITARWTSSAARRRPDRAVRTRRRCGTTWASPSTRTTPTRCSSTRSTSGSRTTAARRSPTSAAATTPG